jgi:UDP-3-O-[3-hydroxymyristoyl] glucosamine N-acyltransferase
LRRMFNRLLHSLARALPGSTTMRPMLHRMRGVKIGKGVFIAEDVYMENEYPEAVEIRDGAQIGLRTIILAHTRGVGRVVIGENAWIGPNVVVAAPAGRCLTIGNGAVIGAGVILNNDVPSQMFVACPPAKAVAKATVPLATTDNMGDFIRGLVPIRSHSKSPTRGRTIKNSSPLNGKHSPIHD